MDTYCPAPSTDIVGFVKHHLPGAIEFANTERAALEKARAVNLQVMIDRGTCFAGHSLDLPEVPINSLGTHSCGYCTNARATS